MNAKIINILLTIAIVLTITNCGGSDGNKEGEDMTKLHQLKTPIFWAEGHPGELNRENWKVEITGLCETPTTFTWNELTGLPKTIADARLTSVTKWSVRGDWGGVKLSDLFELVKPKDNVRYVRFWSVGLDYDTSIPLDIAMKERTLLAWEFDGEYLDEDYGGPMRIFCPYLWGYKSAKSVVKIELMDHYEPGFWELRGYTDSGEIVPSKVRDINEGGKVKTIPGGEVKGFLEDR